MLSVPRLMAATTAVCTSPDLVAAAYARSRASIATGSCPVHQAACARVSRSGGVSCPALSAETSRSYASRHACCCSAALARSRSVVSNGSVIGSTSGVAILAPGCELLASCPRDPAGEPAADEDHGQQDDEAGEGPRHHVEPRRVGVDPHQPGLVHQPQ